MKYLGGCVPFLLLSKLLCDNISNQLRTVCVKHAVSASV